MPNGLNYDDRMKLSKEASGGDTSRGSAQRDSGKEAHNNFALVSRESVAREALLHQCVRLAKILQYEFLFAPVSINT